jgi:hypothetical protein
VEANIQIVSRWTQLAGIPNPAQIEMATEYILKTVQQTVYLSTPWARPSVWAYPSFIPECRDAIKLTRLLRRVYTVTHSPGLGRVR